MAAFTPAATVINKLTAKVCSPSPSTLFTDVAAAATFSLHPLVQSTTLQRTPQRQGMMDADAVALINPNPVVHERKARAPRVRSGWRGVRCLLQPTQSHSSVPAAAPAVDCDVFYPLSLPLSLSSPHHHCSLPSQQTPPQQLLAAAASTAAGDDDIDDAADGPCCSGRELIDAAEVFDHIRDITDPEHPYSLEQLNVVEEQLVLVDDPGGHVR